MTWDLPTLALSVGALGTAAFGIVEALKWTNLGEAGFKQIEKLLGAAIVKTLRVAYGPNYEQLLRAQYRQDAHLQTGIGKTLRQGVRIGLNAENATLIAEELGTVDGESLATAARAVAEGGDIGADKRAVIGRFEVAVDARIESALSRAQDVYIGTMRVAASIVAILMSELVVLTHSVTGVTQIQALLIGIAAVPMAPIANDVVGALQAATKALKAR